MTVNFALLVDFPDALDLPKAFNIINTPKNTLGENIVVMKETGNLEINENIA